MSTHFCTTQRSNIFAQVYGKHNKLFTSMYSCFLLVNFKVSTNFCTTQNSNISAQVYGKHNKLFNTFVLRKTQTFLHRFTASITICLQAGRVVFCWLWCCAPFAQLYTANNAHNLKENLKVSTHLCNTQNSNISAHVYGKHKKLFTST